MIKSILFCIVIIQAFAYELEDDYEFDDVDFGKGGVYDYEAAKKFLKTTKSDILKERAKLKLRYLKERIKNKIEIKVMDKKINILPISSLPFKLPV